VVRQRSAKPLSPGSNPGAASIIVHSVPFFLSEILTEIIYVLIKTEEKRLNGYLKGVVIGFIVLMMQGCALNPLLHHYHRTTITSNPAGARVFMNDKLIGKTPLVFYEQEEGSYLIRLEKEGYEPLIQALGSTSEKTSKKNWGFLWRVPLIKLPPSLPDKLNFNLTPKES
jgi:hypothetical protein